jgi:hypothetical protein
LFPLFLLLPGALQPIPYDLSRPAQVFRLPDQLTEVSALTDLSAHQVACLHDEEGAVYTIDLRTEQVMRLGGFAGAGDFEGLTRVGDRLLALRSDGMVYRCAWGAQGVQLEDTFRLNVPNKNLEGLGYHDKAGLVLVSPKDVPKGGPELRDVRVIYGFDPNAPRPVVREVLTLSLEALTQVAIKRGYHIPTRTTEKGRTVSQWKLRYSSVAVHPMTGHYYLLSAVDRSLLVVDEKGELVHLAWLDASILPKPEGITFLANGDLVLSSEGKGTHPMVVRYARLP